ncbi:MAG: glycosyl transferase family 2 [Cellulomonas sp. 73-92]|uniref:polysaccharide deacetylase family protein n=1 Tax=Cellulomonas sp. 73-92 TaxID=1895740 RepID=UPI00092C18D1|nr:polysaccharide deacetylase family protein [Cellulomonas sp. 73-92]OJV83400.1 MAG: glycosyl transferase family 2 [Cellulomonas sp. 73-92]
MSELRNVCFHGIGTPARSVDAAEARYWVTRDEFLRILDDVAGWPSVALSFDDGNASDERIGLPALVERGLAATFFVLAGRLDTAGSLGRDDVRALADTGMTVGSHGMNHVSWRALDPAARTRELVTARAQIAEASGRLVDQAAFPRGQYDRTALAALRGLGYHRAFTSDARPARPGAWLQPRYSVTRDDTVDSLRGRVLTPAPLPRRLVLEAKGLAKRLR